MISFHIFCSFLLLAKIKNHIFTLRKDNLINKNY